MHFLRDFRQVLIIQLDQQHDAGPSLTRSRRCCILRKHGEKPGDFTPPRRASCCPTPKIAFPLAGTSCVENKQWDANSSRLCKACFLWITPAFLFFFILRLCLQTPFLFFTVSASVQTPVPIAGCQEAAFQPDVNTHHGLTRAQQLFLSACSDTQSREGRGAGLSWKFPFCMIIFPVSIQAGSRLPFVIFKIFHASTIS